MIEPDDVIASSSHQGNTDPRGRWHSAMKNAYWIEFWEPVVFLSGLAGALLGVFAAFTATPAAMLVGVVAVCIGVLACLYGWIAYRVRYWPESEFQAWLTWLSGRIDSDEEAELRRWVESTEGRSANLSKGEMYCRRLEHRRVVRARLNALRRNSNVEAT